MNEQPDPLVRAYLAQLVADPKGPLPPSVEAEMKAAREPRPSRAPRISYARLWNERRRRREGNKTPGQWVRDNLWRAALYERRAREATALITSVMDHATDDFLWKLVRSAEAEWKRADEFYALYLKNTRAAA